MYYTAKELRKARESITMTAIEYGVPEAEVRAEMKKAMDAGRRDPDPAVQARWAAFR